MNTKSKKSRVKNELFHLFWEMLADNDAAEEATKDAMIAFPFVNQEILYHYNNF